MSSTLTGHWLVDAVGWAILHSLWQGAVIGLLVAAALRALAGSTANRRYVVACVGLAAMAAAWLMTAEMHVASAVPARQAVTRSVVVTSPQITRLRVQAPRVSTATSAAPRTGFSWRATLDAWSFAIVLAWLGGVCLLSVRLAYGWVQVQRVRRATQPIADAVWDRAHALAARVRISRPVHIAQSAAVHVPTVVGWLKPMILLPVSALAGLSPSQLDAIIAHELAHVRRHDYAVNIVQTAIEVVMFYHPACWWISRQIRHERELCCDDIAVAVCGDRVAYVEALTEMETLRADAPALGMAMTGPARRGAWTTADGPLLRRVRRLLGTQARHAESRGVLAVSVPATLAVIAITTTTLLGAHVTHVSDTIKGVAPLLYKRVAAPVATAPRLAQTDTPTAARIIPAGEGVVQGRVVDDASKQPVRDARVEMFGPGGAITATTDRDGRYEATGVQPGEYRVSVTAAGYVTANYGQDYDTPEVGMPLRIDGGRITNGIDFALRPAAVLSGRITDEHGKGLTGVEVELVADREVNGLRGVGVGFAQSEDDGAYHFDQVLPGQYWVRAYVDGQFGSEATPGQAYGNTYYPGVGSLDTAQPIYIAAGQQLPGVDFSLVKESTHVVGGRLVDPGGVVSGIDISLHTMAPANTNREYSTKSDSLGRFSIPHVASGHYMLTLNDSTTPRQMPTMRWAAGSRMLDVSEDVNDLTITAQAPAHVEGRIVADSRSNRKPDLSGVHLAVQRPLPGGGFMATGFLWSTKEDGQFSFNVPGVESTFDVSGVPDGWMVRRITVDGTDTDQRPVTLAPGNVVHIEVVLTDRVTHLSGKVTNKDGEPVAGANVLVFPDGPLPPRIMPSPESRWIRLARTERDGRFAVAGLTPGLYRAVALDRLPYFAAEDPQLLQQLGLSAVQVRIGEGGRESIALRVVAAPPAAQGGTPQARNDAPAPVARMVMKRVVLQIARPAAQISGTVHNVAGRGVEGATALLVPDALSPKAAAAAARQARTDGDGHFTFDAVAPGRYFVIATKAPEYALNDEHLLANLDTFATTIRVTEGEPRAVSLLILPPPPPPAPAAPPAARPAGRL